MPKLEIAALTVEDAVRAQQGGADSVEISRDLSVGGLSPALEIVQRARDATTLDIYVMIRPHGRDFRYNAHEVDLILDEARVLAATGVQGVVFGAVTAENRLDVALTRQVATAAAPLPVTVHRALDLSFEPEEALAALVAVVPRILTGGPAATAYEARFTLAEWVRSYGDRLRFVVSGGLRLVQMPEMLRVVRAHEYHFGSAAQVAGAVDTEKVRALRAVCDSAT